MLNAINEAMFTYSIWSLKFMQRSVLSLIFLDGAFMLMREEKNYDSNYRDQLPAQQFWQR